MGSADDDLESLLGAAAAAAPADRISFRNALAARGAAVVPAMAAWLADARLGAFAVRVLERVAASSIGRTEATSALQNGSAQAANASISADIVEALWRLGVPAHPASRRRPTTPRAIAPGIPGKPGRRYWAMHTWERTAYGARQRAFVWSEIRRGRLRQGWGWSVEEDLRRIDEHLRDGQELTDDERSAWRAHRMLTTLDDAIHVGDIVIAVAVPEWHQHAILRTTGSYEYAVDLTMKDYGHILPVELLAEPVWRTDVLLSDALRAALRNRLRLWNIDGVGGDVEHVLARVRVGHLKTADLRGLAGDAPRHRESWSPEEWDEVFERFPPTGERPSDPEIQALATDLGRTFDAISWTWTDASTAIAGRPTTAPQVLIGYLRERGWLFSEEAGQ